MKARWDILEHHLVLLDGKNVYHPNASDIYAFMSNDAKPSNLECDSPIDALPEIRFSKVGSAAKICLTNDASGNVYFTLYALRRGKQVEVDIVDGKIIDQCVDGDTWFYLSGTNQLIQEIIDKAEIKTSGLISLKQYLKVAEQDLFGEVKLVDNQVDYTFFQQPVTKGGTVPVGLKATLFPYQNAGFFWIKAMLETNNGCLLGDEMGLGKTMQVITEMLYLKEEGHVPILVVAPISLLMNWYRECKKFAPSLNVHIHHGSGRISNYKDFSGYDVIVTSYTTVVSDIHMLNMIEWQLVVLDEAQNIKNPESARARMCKAINRDRSLAVSGTPFENHVTDIWSLVDFIQPGLLGSLASFKEAIPDDIEGGKRIEPILSALMVRRLVKDVAQDLPEKIVSTQPLQMSDSECEQYCQYLDSLRVSLGEGNPTLAMLQQLRMYCTHPYVSLDEPPIFAPLDISVKYQRLCEIVEEIVSRDEKVIVFTSYKKMFEVFRRDIPNRFGIQLWTINGETPVEERQQIVDRFNNLEHSAMLVLNPKAAGTGLNITGANHVIHYNLEWNPSLEDQSSARAYRRGQQKTVFIYRLYYTDTVEEVVNDRIERKRDIASYAIIGNDGENQEREDLVRALELIPTIRK